MSVLIAEVAMSGDPQRRVNTIKIFGAIDMLVAVVSVIFHTFLFVWYLIYPIHTQEFTDSAGVFYLLMVLMSIVHTILFGVSWKLITGAQQLSVDPIIAIKAGKRWRHWSICAVILFIVILTTVVLSSGPRVSDKPTQFYMVYLLALSCCRGYAIWYIGKFLEEALCFNSGPDNNIYFVPNPTLLINR